jgi:threonyl-tRNA synthetase
LDFQLPERFNLSYVTAEDSGAKFKPVIIHRAILGSVERMIAILTESFGGKWPFWLSPRQAICITVGEKFDEYAHKVKEQIYRAGFECDVNSDEGMTLNKKVRNAQLENYNFILVIGDKEQQTGTVNVRTRDNKVHGQVSVDEVIERFSQLAASRTNNAEDEFDSRVSSSSSSSAAPTGEAKAAESTTKTESKKDGESFDSAKFC